MKKIINKKFLVLCLAAVMVFGIGALGSQAYAVEGGQQLAEPEEGWQRVDDSNGLILYDDSWQYYPDKSAQEFYNSTVHHTKIDIPGSKVTFKFKGTKFRLIGARNNGTYGCYGSQKVSLNIDGKEYENISCFGDLIFKCMLCDIEGLDNNIHTVTVTNDTSYYLWVDAIDIDKDGCMMDSNKKYVNGVNLDENSLLMNVGEKKLLKSSVLPEDAENKDITWTSSDTNVCTVDENGKVTAVATGNVVITATAKDGSEKSASCKVTVVDNSRAILTINMNNGKSYSYDLTMTEINAFDTWYMDRANGKGSPFYKLTLDNGDVHTMNYNNISDYIVHKYQK